MIVLAELVGDGVVVVYSGGRIAYANPAFAELVGRQHEDLVGEPVDEVIAPHADGSRPTIRHVVGSDRPCLLRSAAVDDDIVMVVRPLPSADDPGTPRRVEELEAVLRNIAWELRRFDVGTLGLGPAGTTRLAPEALQSLSRRERETLDAYLVGLNVTGTADRMHVSVHTVRSHLKAIYRKLGVRSKAELVQMVVGSPAAVEGAAVDRIEVQVEGLGVGSVETADGADDQRDETASSPPG